MNRLDLENRLVDFSVMIIKIVSDMPPGKAGNHLSGQIVRSATSVALNYGEAQSAESKKDFVHKMQIVLKELRETLVCLKIIYRADIFEQKNRLEVIMNENNELISIFVKSIVTAKNRTQLR